MQFQEVEEGRSSINGRQFGNRERGVVDSQVAKQWLEDEEENVSATIEINLGTEAEVVVAARVGEKEEEV